MICRAGSCVLAWVPLLVVCGPVRAAVTVQGNLAWPQALEQVLAQDATVQCFAAVAPGPAQPVDLHGEADDVLPLLAEQYGLQALQLYGVWLVAKAPEPEDSDAAFLAVLATPDGPLADMAATPRDQRMVELGHKTEFIHEAFSALMDERWRAAQQWLPQGRPATGVVPDRLAAEDAASLRRRYRLRSIAGAASFLRLVAEAPCRELLALPGAGGRLVLWGSWPGPDGRQSGWRFGSSQATEPAARAAEELAELRPGSNRNVYGCSPAVWRRPVTLDVAGQFALLATAVQAQTGVEWQPGGAASQVPLRVKLAHLPLWSLPDLTLGVLGEPIVGLKDAWIYSAASLASDTAKFLASLSVDARVALIPWIRSVPERITSGVWAALSADQRAALTRGAHLPFQELDVRARRAVRATLRRDLLESAFAGVDRSQFPQTDATLITWGYYGQALALAFEASPGCTSKAYLPSRSQEDLLSVGRWAALTSRWADQSWTFARRDGAYLPRGRSSSPPAAPARDGGERGAEP